MGAILKIKRGWVRRLLAVVVLFSLWPQTAIAEPQEKFGPQGPPKSAVPKKQSDFETKKLSISGVAKNEAGEPVVGAKVYLAAINRYRKNLANTTTDTEGRYSFNDIDLPVFENEKGKHSGSIQVFATADDYGVTWYGMQHVHFYPRPDNFPKREHDGAIYQDESTELNLTFPKPSKLFGIIHDEEGDPIENATVTIRQLDYLDPTGKAEHINYREFWGIHLAPKKIHTCKTDAKGKFEFSGLPYQTYATLHVSHPNYADQRITAGVTDKRMREFQKPAGSVVRIVNRQAVREVRFQTAPISVNPVRVRLIATSTTTIIVVDEENNPLRGFRVSAKGASLFGSQTSDYGQTNKEGKCELDLPPGKYTVFVRPPRTTDRVPVDQELTLKKDEDKTVKILAPLGGILHLRAVDSKNADPIQGVSFAIADGNQRRGLDSVPHYVDDPTTDRDGKMRVLLPAGNHRISVGFSPLPKGYRPTKNEYKVQSNHTDRRTKEITASKFCSNRVKQPHRSSN